MPCRGGGAGCQDEAGTGFHAGRGGKGIMQGGQGVMQEGRYGVRRVGQGARMKETRCLDEWGTGCHVGGGTECQDVAGTGCHAGGGNRMLVGGGGRGARCQEDGGDKVPG